jgi:hypothetical protein
MTTQGGLQRRQQRQTLFAQRGHRAANASKGLSTCNATEAPGDFLLLCWLLGSFVQKSEIFGGMISLSDQTAP